MPDTLVPPEKPDGLDERLLWYRLERLTPEEFGRQPARTWREAELLQGAFRDGQHEAAAEAKRREASKKAAQDSEAKLRKKWGR